MLRILFSEKTHKNQWHILKFHKEQRHFFHISHTNTSLQRNHRKKPLVRSKNEKVNSLPVNQKKRTWQFFLNEPRIKFLSFTPNQNMESRPKWPLQDINGHSLNLINIQAIHTPGFETIAWDKMSGQMLLYVGGHAWRSTAIAVFLFFLVEIVPANRYPKT